MGKKRNHKEENQYFVQWLIATVILLVYFMGTLLGYNRNMKEVSRERVLDKVTKQAIQIRGYYEGVRSEQSNIAKAISDIAVLQDDIFSDEMIQVISTIKEKDELEDIYIIKPTGVAVDSSGEEYSFVEMMDYIADFHNKQSARIVKDSNGNIRTIIAESIQANDRIAGYVVVVAGLNEMKNVVDIPIYSYSIVSDSGVVAETLGDNIICAVGDNILDSVKNMSFTEGTYTTFNQALYGGRSTNVRIQNDKADYYLITQPIVGTNAEVVISVKGDLIERGAEEENNLTKALLLKLIISLVLFILLLVIIYLLNSVAFTKASKELQNKAETDLLTDLLNKISTERKIKEYINEEGSNKTCMMCVLDIDNFKKINDTMGHAFGDEVLASLGRQIRAEFRVSDIIGRTGGDEFIIFLKDLKGEDNIRKEAERVETFFRNFTVGEYTKYSATASIGAAIYPQDGKDFESLYKAADSALYLAKNRGKNQLAFYSDKNHLAD